MLRRVVERATASPACAHGPWGNIAWLRLQEFCRTSGGVAGERRVGREPSSLWQGCQIIPRNVHTLAKGTEELKMRGTLNVSKDSPSRLTAARALGSLRLAWDHRRGAEEA
jgi:hypothetical protein